MIGGREEKVYEAYRRLSQENPSWRYRYDNSYLTSKVLTDYALLSRVDFDGKRVVNIGCFEPIDEVYYASRVGEWYAIDINKEAIDVAQEIVNRELSEELKGKIRFKVDDATSLSFPDNSFDIAVSFSTLDHIPSAKCREKAIGEMCRVLKKGGYLVITVPNRWNLFYRLRVRKGNIKAHGYEYGFSPLELKGLICKNGMKIVESTSSSFNPLSFMHLSLRRLGLGGLIKLFGIRFGYLAQKV